MYIECISDNQEAVSAAYKYRWAASIYGLDASKIKKSVSLAVLQHHCHSLCTTLIIEPGVVVLGSDLVWFSYQKVYDCKWKIPTDT